MARAVLAMRLLSVSIRGVIAVWAALEQIARGGVERLLRPRYTVGGSCQHNGACCRHLLATEDPLTTWPVLRWLSHFWLCRIYPFRRTENAVELPDGRTARIYTCDNLTADLRCREHILRPLLCRRYPRPRYFKPPALHPGCGYTIIDRQTGEVLVSPPKIQESCSVPELADHWRGEEGDDISGRGSPRKRLDV